MSARRILRRSSITTSRPTSQLLSTYVPILPKHIWKNVTPANVGRLSRTTRRSSGPARTRPSSGRPASTSASSAIPTTGASRAPRTRSSSSSSRTPRTRWSPPSRTVSSTTSAARVPRQFDQLKTAPNTTTLATEGNGFTELGFNTYTAGWRCLDHGPPGSGLPGRPRLRDRQADPRQKVLHGYGTPGTTQVPPWERNWHIEPERRPPVRHRPANQKLDAAATRADPTGTGSTRRARRSTSACTPRTPIRATPRTPSSSRAGSSSSGSRSAPRSSTRAPS